MQNEPPSTLPLNVFEDQPVLQVDSSVKALLFHLLTSDSNILDVHLSLSCEGDAQHKTKCTRTLKVYRKPVKKQDPDSDIHVTSKDMVQSPPIDITPHVPEVVLSDTEEFEEMDIVTPTTDESTHIAITSSIC